MRNIQSTIFSEKITWVIIGTFPVLGRHYKQNLLNGFNLPHLNEFSCIITYMRIYRFEHKIHGVGPMSNLTLELIPDFPSWFTLFNDHDPVSDVDWIHYVKNFPDGIQKYHKFGCSTLDELFSLTKESAFEVLSKYGFDLYEFEVDDDSVVFNDGQVVFDSRTAKKIV